MTAFAYWLRDPSVTLTHVTTPAGNTYKMGSEVGAINSPVALLDLDALLSNVSPVVRYIDGVINQDPLFHGGGSGAGGSLGTFASILALEDVYPAASHVGYHASIGVAAPYIDYISDGISWEVSAASGFAVVAVAGTKDGVNDVFTIPDGTVTTCIPVWNGVIQVEGVDFTRVTDTITITSAGKPGASDTLEAIVGRGPVGQGGILITENLTPAPDGINTVFTIPNEPASWCQIVSGALILAEGVGYTRVGATVTTLPGYTPPAGAPFYANHDLIEAAAVPAGDLTRSLDSSRSAVPLDNEKVLVNVSGSNHTLTIEAGMVADYGLALVQASTGTCTLAAGVGVTFIGATLSTATAGDVLTLLYIGLNNYIVKRG